jgi:hypothetical protein
MGILLAPQSGNAEIVAFIKSLLLDGSLSDLVAYITGRAKGSNGCSSGWTIDISFEFVSRFKPSYILFIFLKMSNASVRMVGLLSIFDSVDALFSLLAAISLRDRII